MSDLQTYAEAVRVIKEAILRSQSNYHCITV